MAARLVFLALLIVAVTAHNDKARICYFNHEIDLIPTASKLLPKNIDPTLCTHIIYGYVKINEQGVILHPEIVQRRIKELVALKDKNSKLKVMMGIAVWTDQFLAILKKKAFDRVMTPLKPYLEIIDGVDFGTYSVVVPAQSKQTSDMKLIVDLVQKLRTLKRKMMISVTIPPHFARLVNLFDIVKYFDVFNFAMYDLHIPTEKVLGHHTSFVEIEAQVKQLIDRGFPVKKITIGLATYGRTYTLLNKDKTTIGSYAKGPGKKGSKTQIPGFLATYEMCDIPKSWEVVMSKTVRAPYAFSGDQWVSYDNVESMRKKIALVKSKGLFGVSIMSLNTDDFMEVCQITQGSKALMTIKKIRTVLHPMIKVAEEEEGVVKPTISVPTKGTVLETVAPVSGKPSVSPTKEPKEKVIKKELHSKVKVHACYYNSDARNRIGKAKFTPAMIDHSLCTHVMYAFAEVVATEKRIVLRQRDLVSDIKELKALKSRNPKIKILLGIDDNSGEMTLLLKDPTAIVLFARSIVKVATANGFDGVDLFRKTYPKELMNVADIVKVQLNRLVKEIRTAAKSPSFIITVTVSSDPVILDKVFLLRELSQLVNWINLATYDFVTHLDAKVGHHTSLLQVKKTIDHCISIGVPPSKMTLGISTYGRTFKLKNPPVTAVGSAAVGPGLEGKFTKTPGRLAFYEICQGKWRFVHDKNAMVSHGYHGNQWLSYDNLMSILKKVEYALKMKLLGIHVMSVDQDDHHNICRNGRYPLLTASKRRLEMKEIVRIPLKKMETNIKKEKRCRAALTWMNYPLVPWMCDTICPWVWCSSFWCVCE